MRILAPDRAGVVHSFGIWCQGYVLSIAITIAIEKLIRINQTLIGKFSPDPAEFFLADFDFFFSIRL
jgi:hypothetical protein